MTNEQCPAHRNIQVSGMKALERAAAKPQGLLQKLTEEARLLAAAEYCTMI